MIERERDVRARLPWSVSRPRHCLRLRHRVEPTDVLRRALKTLRVENVDHVFLAELMVSFSKIVTVSHL